VDLVAEVTSRSWGGSVPLLVGDLTPFGAWLETDVLLEPGEPVELSFVPPRWPAGVPPLRARGRVACVRRGRRRHETARAGMGIAFRELPAAHALLLARLLRGLPPPLPRRSTPRARVAPRIQADDVSLDALRFEALAPLLTAGRLAAPPAAGRGVVIPFPRGRTAQAAQASGSSR
jgi:hypothetical protein